MNFSRHLLKMLFFRIIFILIGLSSFTEFQNDFYVYLKDVDFKNNVTIYEGRTPILVSNKKLLIPKTFGDYRLLELKLESFTGDAKKTIQSDTLIVMSILSFLTKDKKRAVTMDLDGDKDFLDEEILTQDELIKYKTSNGSTKFYITRGLQIFDRTRNSWVKATIELYPDLSPYQAKPVLDTLANMSIITKQQLKIGTFNFKKQSYKIGVFTHNLGNIFDIRSSEIFMLNNMQKGVQLTNNELQKLSSAVQFGANAFKVQSISADGARIHFSQIKE